MVAITTILIVCVSVCIYIYTHVYATWYTMIIVTIIVDGHDCRESSALILILSSYLFFFRRNL